MRNTHRKPLALSASICFEQSYEGVDGDSASSAELYALPPALAKFPQPKYCRDWFCKSEGEIQPVGGITWKIEGFFKACKLQGLTGEQGVIIPHQNVINLMLEEEVVEAVREGKFHIYAVKTVEEGIEILTGMPAGERGEDGEYPQGTVNYLVEQKLKKYYEMLDKQGKGPEKTDEEGSNSRREDEETPPKDEDAPQEKRNKE